MAMSLFEYIMAIVEDRGYIIDEIDLEDFLEDISDNEYLALRSAMKKGNQNYIIDFVFDEISFQLKSSDHKKGGGDMIKKSKKVKPTKKVDKGRYTNPDDTFKKMTCPKGAEGGPSAFCGCLRYQMAQGLPLKNAQDLCGYIKKKKFGSELYDKFDKDTNLEKIAHHLSIEKDGIYLSLSLYDLSPGAQEEVLRFLGVKDTDELGESYEPLFKIPEPEHLESSAYERLMHGNKKEGEKYHPPTTEELKVDPSGSVDVFLSEKTPEKGSDVSKAWEAWCDEKKLSDEAEKGGMGILRGRGFKVSEVEEVTTTRESAFDRFVEKKALFMKKKAQMYYIEQGDKVELSKNWRTKEWLEDVEWPDLPFIWMKEGSRGEIGYVAISGEFEVDWENGIRTIEMADAETQDAIKKIGTVKRAWTIEKKKISEGEHKRRLDKIRAYEKDIAREVTQEEADDMYYELGREGISQL